MQQLERNRWHCTRGITTFQEGWLLLPDHRRGWHVPILHGDYLARSRTIDGPYESNPANPILTNANTAEYFQAVGRADFSRTLPVTGRVWRTDGG